MISRIWNKLIVPQSIPALTDCTVHSLQIEGCVDWVMWVRLTLAAANERTSPSGDAYDKEDEGLE